MPAFPRDPHRRKGIAGGIHGLRRDFPRRTGFGRPFVPGAFPVSKSRTDGQFPGAFPVSKSGTDGQFPGAFLVNKSGTDGQFPRTFRSPGRCTRRPATRVVTHAGQPRNIVSSHSDEQRSVLQSP
jgi:hypothetical protein